MPWFFKSSFAWYSWMFLRVLLRGPVCAASRTSASARPHLLDLGHQVLGHTDRRRIDQAAVERHRPFPLLGGLLHRLQDPLRPLDLCVGGGEDLVGERDLCGVDRPLALAAERGGATRRR